MQELNLQIGAYIGVLGFFVLLLLLLQSYAEPNLLIGVYIGVLGFFVLLLQSYAKKWLFNYKFENYVLGYGSALADTYFHGYLEIVLPDEGTKCMKGIVERIKHYKLDQQLSDRAFPVHKLFLLVTSSGFSPPNLSDFKSDDRIEWRGCLTEEPVKDRNGVKGRIYKTPVYKAFSENNKRYVYVVMEGAPALRPLYESAKSNPDLKAFFPKIVETFVKHLQRKLDESAECRNKCEIIYCDESEDFILPDEIFKRINKYIETNPPNENKTQVLPGTNISVMIPSLMEDNSNPVLRKRNL